MTLGQAAGSFVSGGIVGVGTVNAPETGGVSFAAAVGGMAGVAGNATQQSVDVATGAQTGGISTTEIAVSGVVGAALGGATEGALPNAKISGLSSGRGNMKAVAKGVQTKIARGNAQNMSTKTAVKAAAGSQAASAYKTVAGGVGDAAKATLCSDPKSGCH